MALSFLHFNSFLTTHFRRFFFMKKSLLLLGLLGMASGLHAQVTTLGPWVEVNTPNSSAIAPGYVIRDVNTLSPNVAWFVAEEISTSAGTIPKEFFVTNNAAGDQFDFGALNAVGNGGASGYQAGNISGISALVAVAATYPAMGAGGEILRTTNGGVSWTKVSTAAQFNGGQGGFCNFVHMFNANEGVSLGDPTAGYFEILRTSNGGVAWARNSQATSPVPIGGEYGLARSFFARGNTIWAGTGSPAATDPARVLKSTDKGVTWTASALTPLLGGISRLAFKDDLNGIAYNVKANAAGTAIGEVNVIRTSDGGATWSSITPVNAATGSFFYQDIDALNGRYYSVGSRFPSAAPFAAADLGSSTSTDGINWTQISSSRGFTTIDVVAGTTANPAGYAGFATDAKGVGGIYKASNIALATRNAALQGTLSVYPNPSATGLFSVDLGTYLKAGAQLTVVDVLGRQVLAQVLNATAIGSRTLSLDLSAEKTGVYTLQIRTEAGIATQKLVVE